MSVFGGCNDVMASNYTCIVCAALLQILSDVISQVWAFSLAFDGSTHQGMSYLDVRVRFVWLGVLYNFHLMAIPLFVRHTGENLFRVLQKFLDALLEDSWKHTCIRVSTDGARNMIGRVQGLVSRVQQVCSLDILQIWCGLHQLDLVMQRVYKPALESEFYSVLTALIGHLRQQQSLIGEMQSTCPKVADTRWVSMFLSTKWLCIKRHRLLLHLDERKPACAPTKLWWVFLHAVNAFATEADLVFTALQGLTTLISQQQVLLAGLIDTYCQMSGMEGPLDEEQISAMMATEPIERSGSFVVSHGKVRLFLDGLGMWVIETMQELELVLESDEISRLCSGVGKLFVTTADGINKIAALHNKNDAVLPPVLPCELAAIDMRKFVTIIQKQ